MALKGKPTIGIVLCHRKNDALVELTLPPDANIFASKYQLYLPSKEELKARPEQTAIATVLSDMDLELAALEQRRDKTRALKQGMMQELLTGRTRLL